MTLESAFLLSVKSIKDDMIIHPICVFVRRYREACLEDELAALQARNKELVRRLEGLQAAFATVHQTYINSILNGQVVWQAQ